MKTFQLTFNEQQLQVLSNALIEIPYKLSAPLIADINLQIQKQFDTKVDENSLPTIE